MPEKDAAKKKGAQPKKGEQSKEKIAEAALQAFAEKGYQEVSMGEIAKRSGFSKGGLYHHFSSKEEIMQHLMQRGTELRFSIMDETDIKYADLSMQERALEKMVDKLIDANAYKRVYALFLLEMQKNEAFKGLYDDFSKQSKAQMFLKAGPEARPYLECFTTDFGIAFINAMIVASEILGCREVFTENREILRKMAAVFLQSKDFNTAE